MTIPFDSVHLVGGAVRDIILGTSGSKPKYIVVGVPPELMLKSGFLNGGTDSSTYLDPVEGMEFSLARNASKKGKSRRTPSVTASIEDELSLRDLTMNAVAMTSHGIFIDPFKGRADLTNRILRHVSKTSFLDDPIRVLRLARFAAKYPEFTVDPLTLKLAKACVRKGGLALTTPDSVWSELTKGLMCSKPSRMFEILRATGALKMLIPELDALWGIEQRKEHHPEIDCGIHTMMVIDNAALHGYCLEVRVACLFHDLGKGVTPKDMLPKHFGHEVAGAPLVHAVCSRLNVPTDLTATSLLMCTKHIDIHGIKGRTAKSIVKILMELDAIGNASRFEHILLACMADARGRLGRDNVEYPQAEFCRSVAHVVASVNVSDIEKKCVKPEHLAQQITHARVEAVQAFVETSLNIS